MLAHGFAGHSVALLVDTLLASATETTPAIFYDPVTMLRNGLLSECRGAGGGGTTNTGAGGGGQYSASHLQKLPSTGYAIVVGTSAANTDGAVTTFNTTDVVANGGKSGTNGGAGGTAGTGTVRHDGGAGQQGAGNKSGGGAGGNTTAGSGTTPGTVDGGRGSSAAAPAPGGGGGSSAGAQSAGGLGRAQTSYFVPATPGFARLFSASWGRDVADGTTRNIVLPPGSGGTLIVWSVSDAGGVSPVISMAGWTATTQINEATLQVSGRVFYLNSAGGDPVELATDTSESMAWICTRWYGPDGGPVGAITVTTAQGNSANADPPANTPGGNMNYTYLACAGWDGSTNANVVTGIPASFGCALMSPFFSTTAVEAWFTRREVAGTTLNPGAFASGSEQWVAVTVSIAPS